MKKILVVLETEPEYGGAHQYASTIMDCLIEMDSNEIEVVAICKNRYWRKWCKKNGIRILTISWYEFSIQEQKYHLRYSIFSRVYSMYISQIGKVFLKEKLDVILTTSQGMFIPNLSIKVIVPVHDLMHRYEQKFPEVRNNYEAREVVFSSNAKYAECILTDSKVGTRQFVESYSGYMKNKTPYVISMPFIVPRHVDECTEEFIEVSPKYIFYPAQFWQHKNHLNLIKAIKILSKDIPDIHLVLVGSEKNNMKTIKKIISENCLDKNVTILGFVSNENVTYLYKHAVGLVMPSYFGPTNIPPLEAMALGCPVAVSNKYAMPEQVGDAGLLFNPDSPEEIAACIKAMWLDDTLRQHMIRKGYDRVNRWTKQKFREKLQKILINI